VTWCNCDVKVIVYFPNFLVENADSEAAIADILLPSSNDIFETLTAFIVPQPFKGIKAFQKGSGAISTSHHSNSVDICG
jgi:hypothetical protein